MKPTNESPTSTAAGVLSVVFVLIHAVLAAVLLVGLVGFVPRFEKMFADFDYELPVMTQWTIYLSRSAVSYWYLLVVAGGLLLAIDFAVLIALGRSGRLLQCLWGLLWIIVPMFIAVWLTLAIWLPLSRLAGDLM
jgi:type II secretory pathway component PulF